jgi:flagellin
MALVINTNVASLNAQRHLSGSQSKLAVSMERLSTGLRINSGQDDGAGLAIGSKLGAKVRGLNQAVRNANDGISLAKTGDAALAEVGSMLERMRELATQKVNGALGASDIANITTELTALNTEITAIKTNATFNGTALLSAKVAAEFQVGEAAADKYTFNITVGAINPAATDSIANIESAIDEVTKARAAFGSAATALESRANNSAALAENLSAARSRIMDADIAQESANMTKASVLQQAGVSVLAQANQAPNVVLSLLR